MPTASLAEPAANGPAIMETDLRPPESLRPHPDNPRGDIDMEDAEMIALINDVRRKGVLQNLIITPDSWILAGHRRQAAAIAAGLELVPVAIRELSKGEHPEDYFLSENMLRNDLNPLETAIALRALQTKLESVTRKPVTFGDLHRRTGIGIGKVSELLAILDLPESVRKLFRINELPVGCSKFLRKLKDYPEACEEIARKVASREITKNSLDAVTSRKLKVLEEAKDQERNEALRPTIDKIQGRRGRPNGYTAGNMTQIAPVTRESAMSALLGNMQNTITLDKVKGLFDSSCHNCGMQGLVDVCKNCPLPRLIQGIVGRSSKPGGYDDGD